MVVPHMSDVAVPPAAEGAQDPAERATWWQLTGCIGCGSMILLVFLLTWLVSGTLDKQFLSEPAAVEANLRQMVDAEVPPGLRGFRGFHSPGHPEIERIAVLAPADYDGQDTPVDVPLVISVWTFGPAWAPDERLSRMARYWEDTASKRFGDDPVEVVGARPTTLTARGRPVAAEERRLVVGEVELKLILALVPAAEEGVDLAPGRAPSPGAASPSGELGVAFIGKADGFDQATLERFVASIRSPGP